MLWLDNMKKLVGSQKIFRKIDYPLQRPRRRVAHNQVPSTNEGKKE